MERLGTARQRSKPDDNAASGAAPGQTRRLAQLTPTQRSSTRENEQQAHGASTLLLHRALCGHGRMPATAHRSFWTNAGVGKRLRDCANRRSHGPPRVLARSAGRHVFPCLWAQTAKGAPGSASRHHATCVPTRSFGRRSVEFVGPDLLIVLHTYIMPVLYLRQLRVDAEGALITWPNDGDVAPETRYAHTRRHAAANA